MNIHLAAFARLYILTGLKKLPDSHIVFFKRMYSPLNLNLSIEQVVESMEDNKLNWAMTQVQNSLDTPVKKIA